MKVLQVNKFNHFKGGADRYFLELSKLLAAGGCEVAKFCMTHPDNFPSKWDEYFVSQVDMRAKTLWPQIRTASRVLWSFEAQRKIDHLMENFRPDVVHLHNIYHQISPSILPVIKKRGVPIVMHLHDWKLISPDYKLFSRGVINTSYAGGNYWRCVPNACVKHSYGKSLLATTEMYLHHSLLKVYERNVDLYLAPTNFTKDLMTKFGVPEEKIKVLKHFIDTKNYKPEYKPGKNILFFGRLEVEKGVDILLRAFSRLASREHRLTIVGSGSQYKELMQLAYELGIKEQVDFLGPKTKDELKTLIQNCYVVVMPSVWYEIFGLVNLEASACGKPVLASDIGGIPEAINNSTTGLLFKAGSVEDLATKLAWLIRSPKAVEDMGREARHYVEQHFSPEEHLRRISSIYRSLMK